jgi:hypothetical protein
VRATIVHTVDSLNVRAIGVRATIVHTLSLVGGIGGLAGLAILDRPIAGTLFSDPMKRFKE